MVLTKLNIKNYSHILGCLTFSGLERLTLGRIFIKKVNNMRIIFMGSPDFAVDSLEILLENGYDIVGVITATDKLGGRGRKQVIESAVKQHALDQGLNVLQPKNLKSKLFHKNLKSLGADLQVVVAFRMLPEIVWDMPPLGTINLHASLLPKYRGAAPINWAIMKGETETGLTTFRIQKEIDTGDLLFQHKMSIHPDETAGSLYARMKKEGAKLVLKSVQAIESGNPVYHQQSHENATPAPKIHPETCEIDLRKNVDDAYNHIRGLSPYPGAWTYLEHKRIKILKAEKVKGSTLKIGFHSDKKNYLRLYFTGGYINIHEVQLEGKRKMEIREFLNGYKWDNAG